eukprot:2006567-Pleurochrysis_carterae.AAC.1
MMRDYPDVKKCPGVEDWLPPDKWSMSKVFDDIHRWKYVVSNADEYCRQWEALRVFQTAYSTANSITVGMLHDMDAVKGLKRGGCPPVSWSEMWQ